MVDFTEATSYGLVEIESRWLHEAEDEGAAAIEVAIAWLIARGRYGLVRLPNGRGREFSRQRGLRPAATGHTVLVVAPSGRRWLRWRGPGEPVAARLRAESPELEPALPRVLEARERQALLALQRAATETVVESQLQALWEAIELYTAETAAPKLFSKTKLKDLRTALAEVEDLSEEQEAAVARAVAGLNHRATADLLTLRLRKDGVPLSDRERAVVDKLRTARNEVVHGRAMQDPPTRADIEHGISLVARMLVYRVAAVVVEAN